MEGLALALWYTQMVSATLIVDLQVFASSTPPLLCTWEVLCQSLCNIFYSLKYHKFLLTHWLYLQ